MNYAYILFGALCIAGAAYVFVTEHLKKEKNERNKIGVFGAAGVVVSGIAFIISGFLDDISIFAFIFTFLLGSGFAATGIYNLNLYRTCRTLISAEYVRCCKTGKRGENAIPVFSYTFKGEEYTSRSAQQVPSSLIGSKYRTDLPCQIMINPKKPATNILKTEKPVEDIAKIVIGAAVIVGAFALHYYLNVSI